MTLCDGTTSEEVLKLMSPVMAKIMDQRKKQSLWHALENINVVQTPSCIKSLKNTSFNDCNI
jgi:hypothetical protein